jgi:hypothetical protein
LAGHLPLRNQGAALNYPSQPHERALTHDVHPLAPVQARKAKRVLAAALLPLACDLDHAGIGDTCAAPYIESRTGEISAANIPARSPV